jgi:hypothetical protein
MITKKDALLFGWTNCQNYILGTCMFLCEKKGGDSGSVYIFEKNETSGS